MLAQDFFTLLQAKALSIIVDNAALIPLCKNYASNVFHYTEFDFQQCNTGLLLSSSLAFAKGDLKKIIVSHQSKIMLFPLAKHAFARGEQDDFFRLVDYSLCALTHVDAVSCLSAVQKLKAQLSHGISLFSHSTQVALTIVIHVVSALAMNDSVRWSETWSPYALLEYALFQTEKSKRFVMNGLCQFQAILVSGDSETDAAREAKNTLIRNSNASEVAYLEIKNNEIVVLMIDHVDVTYLLDVIGVGRYVVEIAFGVNQRLQKQFNRCINSPMNEGIFGMHIGVGTGKNTYHIDFILPGVDFSHFKIQQSEHCSYAV